MFQWGIKVGEVALVEDAELIAASKSAALAAILEPNFEPNVKVGALMAFLTSELSVLVSRSISLDVDGTTEMATIILYVTSLMISANKLGSADPNEAALALEDATFLTILSMRFGGTGSPHIYEFDSISFLSIYSGFMRNEVMTGGNHPDALVLQDYYEARKLGSGAKVTSLWLEYLRNPNYEPAPVAQLLALEPVKVVNEDNEFDPMLNPLRFEIPDVPLKLIVNNKKPKTPKAKAGLVNEKDDLTAPTLRDAIVIPNNQYDEYQLSVPRPSREVDANHLTEGSLYLIIESSYFEPSTFVEVFKVFRVIGATRRTAYEIVESTWYNMLESDSVYRVEGLNKFFDGANFAPVFKSIPEPISSNESLNLIIHLIKTNRLTLKEAEKYTPTRQDFNEYRPIIALRSCTYEEFRRVIQSIAL